MVLLHKLRRRHAGLAARIAAGLVVAVLLAPAAMLSAQEAARVRPEAERPPAAADFGRLFDAVVERTAKSFWDKERLAQAVTNLVANAVQHGTRDGLIRVAACGDEPGTVTVSVANEGPAIPHDRIAGIFDAMKETGSGEDRQHLGLGLYIVDKIVEAHAGSVDLHSSDKEGTTVVVSLPRDRVAHPSNSGTRS